MLLHTKSSKMNRKCRVLDNSVTVIDILFDSTLNFYL